MILIYKNYIIFVNKNNQLHRENGPAIKYTDGAKPWYQNGIRHRLDGPALINSNGDKSWFINGIEYSEGDYYIKLKEMNINL